MASSAPCGPHDRSLLSFQDQHVSSNIWAGIDRDKLNLRQGTSRLADWDIKEPQKFYIEKWGFGVFCNPHVLLQNDINLISSLVERWRPETNSFHFPFGEMTITLEDVNMLLGLPVCGSPIIHEELHEPKPFWMSNWPDPNLTAKEKSEMYKKGGVSLRKLRERYCELPKNEEANDDAVRLYSLAYVLYIIGSVLFPSSSPHVVHGKYSQLLMQPDHIISYAWGAGVLGYLYRGLYKASRKEINDLEGCATLVQLWSYERLLPGCPEIAPDQEYTWPRAVAWAVPVEDRYKNAHHHLRLYRGYFDTFDRQWLTWEPYAHIYRLDDDELEDGRYSGLCRVPLIHWDIVEYQMSDRVLRQFGVLQHIPGPPVDVWELRRSKPPFHKENYIVTLAMYVHEWDLLSHGGADFVSERDYCPIEEYMRWYQFITKLRISPHDIHLPRIIQPRDWCDQLLMVNGMKSAMNLVSEIYRRDPPEYFYDLIPGFLAHFDRVMVEVEGPGFERPTFPRRAPMEVVEPTVTTANPSSPVDFNTAGPSTTSDPMDFNTVDPTASVPMDSNTAGPSTTTDPMDFNTVGPTASVPMDSNTAGPSTTTDPMDFNTVGPTASVPMDSNTAGPSTSSTSVPRQCDTAGPSTSPFQKMPRDYYNDIYEIDTKEDLLVDVRRGGLELKGEIKRALKSRKARWLYGNWWSKEVEVEIAARPIKGVEVEVISHRNLFYSLDKSHLLTLKPRNEVADVIVNAYFELLREREKRYFENENVARHFFMPSEFMEVAKFYVQVVKKHPLDRSEDDLKALKSFLVNVAKQHRADNIDDCEIIYFPTCHEKHWFLFIWNVVDQKVVLLDSLRNDSKFMKLRELYRTQYYIMEKLVPVMLHIVNKTRFPEIKWGRVKQLVERPMQVELDCGIFVCKYVDAYLMGLSIEKQRWSREDIRNFRFRIAWELRKGEARHIPKYCSDWRLKFPRIIGETKKRDME